jgi:hypothetical protein
MKKVISNFVVVIAVLTVLTSCSNVTDKQVVEQLNEEQQVAKVERWEYKIVEKSSDWYYYVDGKGQVDGNGRHLRFSYGILNSLGKEGWELVTSNTTQYSERYAFKRRLP